MLEIRHQAVADGVSTQDAYDSFYEESEIMLRDSFYMWLVELLKPTKGSMLLDISCGQGRLVQLAQKRGLKGIGLDFALEGLRRGALLSPDVMWLVGDGEQIPFADGSFDYVTHIGSLEHYADFYAGASEIARLLTPDGRACILLPNSFGLIGNVRRVYHTGEIFFDDQPLQRYGTRATWERVLQVGGLEVERMVPWGEFNYPRTFKDLIWTLLRPQKLIRALIVPFIPKNLANHFVFICRRSNKPLPDDHYPMLPPPSNAS